MKERTVNKKKMKRIISVVVIIVAIIAGSTNLNAITSMPKTEDAVLEVSAPPLYWSGRAFASGWWMEIKVYQDANSCNSFYAVVTGAFSGLESAIGETLVVKSDGEKKYHVTWNGRDYYFKME